MSWLPCPVCSLALAPSGPCDRPDPPPQVGHTFVLGQLYSEALGAFTTAEAGGGRVPLHMGCYGLGVTRLLGAVVEARARPGEHLSWPLSLAPFKLCVVTPKVRLCGVHRLADGSDAGGVVGDVVRRRTWPG